MAEQTTTPPVLEAAHALASLTEVQRTAVVNYAGTDPAKQLRTIEALRPTWAAPASPAVPATPEPSQPPPPPTPHLDEYQRISTWNPALAARFANAHASALSAERGALRDHAAPTPPPPAPAPPPPSPEHLEQHERLRAVSPVLAAIYHNHYAPQILAARRVQRGAR